MSTDHASTRLPRDPRIFVRQRASRFTCGVHASNVSGDPSLPSTQRVFVGMKNADTMADLVYRAWLHRFHPSTVSQDLVRGIHLIGVPGKDTVYIDRPGQLDCVTNQTCSDAALAQSLRQRTVTGADPQNPQRKMCCISPPVIDCVMAWWTNGRLSCCIKASITANPLVVPIALDCLSPSSPLSPALSPGSPVPFASPSLSPTACHEAAGLFPVNWSTTTTDAASRVERLLRWLPTPQQQAVFPATITVHGGADVVRPYVEQDTDPRLLFGETTSGERVFEARIVGGVPNDAMPTSPFDEWTPFSYVVRLLVPIDLPPPSFPSTDSPGSPASPVTTHVDLPLLYEATTSCGDSVTGQLLVRVSAHGGTTSPLGSPLA